MKRVSLNVSIFLLDLFLLIVIVEILDVFLFCFSFSRFWEAFSYGSIIIIMDSTMLCSLFLYINSFYK